MFEFFYDNSLAVVLAFSLGSILLGLALSRKRSLPPRSSDVYRTLAQDAVNRQTEIGKNAVMTFEKIPTRQIGKRRELAASYAAPTRKPTIALTPRQIERVNIVRKQRGARPLNNVGIKSAISAAWDTPRREPATTNDWLTYLILYEVFFAEHTQTHCAGAGGVLIDPNLPYNGAGGEFAGAGASGDWTSAPSSVAAIAGGIAVGASASYLAMHLQDGDPLSNPDSFKGNGGDKYKPGDEVGGYGPVGSDTKPVPVESYTKDWTSVPDPTPVAQSYSAPASVPDSTPASSPDSGGSSGGDSGGGGGGGGGD